MADWIVFILIITNMPRSAQGSWDKKNKKIDLLLGSFQKYGFTSYLAYKHKNKNTALTFLKETKVF